jgi:D-glycero-alpha-D-manno-heptose-7-phosphate kinase
MAVAHGGFNKISFNKDKSIVVAPVTISADTLSEFQKHLMLFFTGTSRSASEVSALQIKNTASNENQLREMHRMVNVAEDLLIKRDIDAVGRLLHESWCLKKGLTSLISNSQIDEIYKVGLTAGALGGKLLGAGAGGFVLFYADPAIHQKIQERLRHLLYVPFRFETKGSRIIYQEVETSF